jgi:hypothetical protein
MIQMWLECHLNMTQASCGACRAMASRISWGLIVWGAKVFRLNDVCEEKYIDRQLTNAHMQNTNLLALARRNFDDAEVGVETVQLHLGPNGVAVGGKRLCEK